MTPYSKKFKVNKDYTSVCRALSSVPFLEGVSFRIATSDSKSSSHWRYSRSKIEGWVSAEGYSFLSRKKAKTSIEITADFKEQLKSIYGELEKKLF